MEKNGGVLWFVTANPASLLRFLSFIFAVHSFPFVAPWSFQSLIRSRTTPLYNILHSWQRGQGCWKLKRVDLHRLLNGFVNRCVVVRFVVVVSGLVWCCLVGLLLVRCDFRVCVSLLFIWVVVRRGAVGWLRGGRYLDLLCFARGIGFAACMMGGWTLGLLTTTVVVLFIFAVR